MALFDTSFDFNFSQSKDSAKGGSKKSSSSSKDSFSSSGSSKAMAKADTSDIDRQIEVLRDAMKEASGFKRRELEARLKEAEQERKSRIEAAKISAEASRYSADRSLEGTRYSADRSLEGTKYSSDNSLRGTMYSADSSAAASRYSTDAELYRFLAEQPLKRGEQALSFVKTYTDLSQRPDNWLQASNYARLGYQTEGMPGMMADLLGNVNPNAAGNLAFRTGQGAMPQTAAQAIFGENPLSLAQRTTGPALPVWNGPQGAGTGYAGTGMPTWTGPQGSGTYNPGLMSAAFAPNNGAIDHRGKLVSDSYGAQAGLPLYYQPTSVEQAPRAAASGDGTTPRILTDGLVTADTSQEDQFLAATRDLMQRGAHQWGQQTLEKMTPTERGLLASGIKAAGGVPEDYFLAYERSRIGNTGSGRDL